MFMWFYEVDLRDEWNDYQKIGFEEFLLRVVEKLVLSDWNKDSDLLEEYLDTLSLCSTEEEFEHEFDRIWDLADEERCWIATR